MFLYVGGFEPKRFMQVRAAREVRAILPGTPRRGKFRDSKALAKARAFLCSTAAPFPARPAALGSRGAPFTCIYFVYEAYENGFLWRRIRTEKVLKSVSQRRSAIYNLDSQALFGSDKVWDRNQHIRKFRDDGFADGYSDPKNVYRNQKDLG